MRSTHTASPLRGPPALGTFTGWRGYAVAPGESAFRNFRFSETMRKTAFALLLGLVACGPAETTYPAGSVNPLALEPPPIYSLFGYRDRLELTSAQVEALDSIAQAVKRSNDPIVDSLAVVADARTGRGRGIIPISDETRPLLERVRLQNRQAAEAVREVLNDTQAAQVCELVDQQAQDRVRRLGEEREARSSRIAPQDSALFLPLRGWPWCGPPTGA